MRVGKTAFVNGRPGSLAFSFRTVDEPKMKWPNYEPIRFQLTTVLYKNSLWREF